MLIIQRIWLAQWAKHTFLNVNIFIINTIFMNPSYTRTHYPLSPCACFISKVSKTDATPVRIISSSALFLDLFVIDSDWPIGLRFIVLLAVSSDALEELSPTLLFDTNCEVWNCDCGIHCLLHCQCVNSSTFSLLWLLFQAFCFPKCCLLCPLLLLTFQLLFLQFFSSVSLASAVLFL